MLSCVVLFCRGYVLVCLVSVIGSLCRYQFSVCVFGVCVCACLMCYVHVLVMRVFRFLYVRRSLLRIMWCLCVLSVLSCTL